MCVFKIICNLNRKLIFKSIFKLKDYESSDTIFWDMSVFECLQVFFKLSFNDEFRLSWKTFSYSCHLHRNWFADNLFKW